jgi:RNA polymerase sigma-70 factor, ECF subfamily
MGRESGRNPDNREPIRARERQRGVTGDTELVGDWVGTRYAKAYRTAVLICGNPADAEEAVQDAFLRAWRFRDALPEDDRRDAWLYRVLVNACYSKLRKEVPIRDRERERIDDDRAAFATVESPEVGAERSEAAGALQSTLQDLPENLRVVVVLRYFSDLSEREIAIAIRRRPGTVKSRLHEARRRLAADARLAPFAPDASHASDVQVNTP